MWESATCPLVTGILLHITHDFLGKIFPVEDEVVEVCRVGVLVGNFHTPKVFKPQAIPQCNDAPRRIPPVLPLLGGWEYTPLIFMSSRGRGTASTTLGPPIVHIPDRGSITHGSSAPPLEPSRRAADLEASSSTRAV